MKRATVLAAIGIFAAILLVAGGLAWQKRAQIRTAAARATSFEPVEAVQFATAKSVNWRPMADLVGTVFSLRSVRVSNELVGRVKSIGFESGSIVEPGQIILALDDSTDRADLAAAEASVRVAAANVAVADVRIRQSASELERLQGAAQARAVAAMELDRSQSESDKARADRVRLVAEVDQATARVDQMKARLEKMVIRAPFRARAGLRSVHEGQYLAENTDIVMLEEVADKIYLDFPIPQEYAARVHTGLTVMATSDALGPDPVRIEVAAIDAVVSNSTRNLRIRAIMDNKDGRLRPGMFVQIRVPVEDERPFVSVPATAARRASYADQVFVVQPAGKEGDKPTDRRVAQRFVRLGPTIGEDVIVLDGVKEGETVAATGAFKLREGSKVVQVDTAKEQTARSAPDAPAR